MPNRIPLAMKDVLTHGLALGRGLRSLRFTAILTVVRALFLSKDVWMQNVLAFLASRAAVLESLHPFGAAFFAAVLVAGPRRRAVAAGLCITLGSMTVLPLERTLALVAWSFVALLLTKDLPGDALATGRGAVGRRTLVLTAIYAICRTASGWLTGMSPHDGVSIGVEAVLMAITAYLLLPVGRWDASAGIRHLERDRSTVVALGLLASVAGLGLLSVEWLWVQPAEVWYRWLVMFVALAGAGGGGAAIGTFLDVLVSLMARLPLGGLGLYGVGGLFGGLLSRRGKVGVACGFLLGQMLVSVHTDGAEEILLGAAHTGVAVVLLALTPGRWIARFARAMRGAEARSHLDLAREKRLREAIATRLRDVGVVFHELADVFSGTGERLEELAPAQDYLNALVERVWQGQCRGCDGFRACWQESFYRSYWGLVDLVALADQCGGAVTTEQLPVGLAEQCTRPEEFVRCFNDALSGRRSGPSARRSSLELVPQQLRGVAELIENTADQVKVDTGRAEEIEERLYEEFAFRRIEVGDVRVSHAAYHAEVEITYSGGCDGCGRCVEILAPVVERVLGERYTGASTCGKSGESDCRVHLIPVPPFELHVEMARLAKDGGQVSGDSFSQLDLGGGRVALMLSDGMGVGDRAAIESRAAVGLFEKMLRAGFDHTFAAHTVNAALLLRSTEEMFATVDLAIVDLFTGHVEFLKVGSSPTFIKREQRVEVVRSESLPVGILSNIDVDANARVLEPGDSLVMMTDGILDTLPDRWDKEEWIARMLRREETRDPAELVKLLIDRATQAAGGEIRDDMTLLVARFVRRKSKHGEIPVYERGLPAGIAGGRDAR